VRNKADIIRDTITDKQLDILALTETWHKTNEDACLRLVTPAGYAIIGEARSTDRGGELLSCSGSN